MTNAANRSNPNYQQRSGPPRRESVKDVKADDRPSRSELGYDRKADKE